ncbi:MAG: hypothetical protein QME90_03895 [Thermodesulfobacteriota bacterium]|nr:hypothetical protein [Thermodesulfobacteriota bacterium]
MTTRKKVSRTLQVMAMATLSLIAVATCYAQQAASTQADKPKKLQKYVNQDRRVSFSYPEGWRAMTADEVRRESKGLVDIGKSFVIVAYTHDLDRNFNISAFKTPPSAEMRNDADRKDFASYYIEDSRRRIGYKKVSWRIVDVAGTRGVEFVFDLERMGLPMRMKQLMVDKEGMSYTFTFAAPYKFYDESDGECFVPVMRSLALGKDVH